MIARLIAVVIDEVRRELRKLDDEPGPEHAQALTLDAEHADQVEGDELRAGF